MASSSAVVKLLCLVVLAVAVATPVVVEALTCGQVASGISPCLGYLRKSVSSPPGGCCSGIKGLSAAASTSADRKTACQCLKLAAGSIKGLDLGLAAGLPGKCGVSVPYKISPSTNCNNVK